jgi:hypothetical protein
MKPGNCYANNRSSEGCFSEEVRDIHKHFVSSMPVLAAV